MSELPCGSSPWLEVLYRSVDVENLDIVYTNTKTSPAVFFSIARSLSDDSDQAAIIVPRGVVAATRSNFSFGTITDSNIGEHLSRMTNERT